MHIQGDLQTVFDALYQMVKDGRKDKKIDYARIRQPVLILWAAAEKILLRWTLRLLRKHLPQAEVVTIRNAGHLLLEERPAECNAAIRKFLEARQPEPARQTIVPQEPVTTAVDEGAVQA